MLKNFKKIEITIEKVTKFQILMKKTNSSQNLDSESFYFLIFGKIKYQFFQFSQLLA